MNETATYIAARTARQVKNKYNRQAWLERKSDIVQVLTDLSPSKPDDGTPGFLAYDVQGHDRMKMRTGRFLTRKLKLNNNFLPDTAIQHIAAQINTKLFGDTDEIRLDSGQQITCNYKDDIGGSSCMTGDAADYVGLYADNPNKIKQLVMRSMNDTARAIVHVLDNGMYHMSRIYATSEDLKQRMRDYARDKKWLYYATAVDVVHSKSMLVVSGLDYTDGEIPYADSLNAYRIENGKLTITHPANAYDGILDSTCGELEDSSRCIGCGEHIDGDDTYQEHGEIYCSGCHGELFSWCEVCEQTHPADDITWVEGVNMSVCDHCLEDYALCGDCNRYFKNDDIRLIGHDDKYVCESCLEDYSCCDNCGDYFSNVEQADNGDFLCENCLEDRRVTAKTVPIKDCEGQKLLPML